MTKTQTKLERSEDGRIIVYNPDDVPEFASERAEVDFWDTHTWSDALYDEAAKLPRDPDLPPPREEGKPPLRPTSLRLERHTTDRLRTLAKRKGMGYQTLLKQFLLERLYEEEKREGIV